MNLAPIVLFVYNRPWHTEQTLHSLELNELANESCLYIYADGAKKDASKEDIKRINETRSLIRSKKWCKEVYIIESEFNLGLADSIVRGVTEQINAYGKVIVLEDDLQLSKGFLKFMNDALVIYEKEEIVMHISGYMFPVKAHLPETFFFKASFCWGWATWKRAWIHLNLDAEVLYKEIVKSGQIENFDFNKNFGLLDQLIKNKERKAKTWAVKWYASIFLKNGLTLLPNHSVVNNIGQDGSGMNSGTTNKFHWLALKEIVNVEQIPLVENMQVRKLLSSFPNVTKRSGSQMMKDKLWSLLNIVKGK